MSKFTDWNQDKEMELTIEENAQKVTFELVTVNIV